MKRPALLLLTGTTAFASLVAAGPADTTHPCYDATADQVVFDEQQVWFHEGETKLGNAGAAPWSTEAPTDSVQAGAGAGALSYPASLADLGGVDPAEAVFAGTFDGCLSTVVVDLYSFDLTNRTGTSASLEPASHSFAFSLVVDGVEVIGGTAAEAATTFANEGLGANRNQFAIDAAKAMERAAARGKVALGGEHTVELRVAAWYANTGFAGYVWDTVEVPSGMSFNVVVPEGVPVVG